MAIQLLFEPLLDLSWCTIIQGCTTTLIGLFVIELVRRRARAFRKLTGIPTVTRRPRLFRGYLFRESLRPSNITGILPRMQRLGGPFGMYGTVYGFDTPVVHVAHPVPARVILNASGSISRARRTRPVQKGNHVRRRSFISETSGAMKCPAYNHFKDFSGDGVFTADGDEWRAKRASVIHCLLKGIASADSLASKHVQAETKKVIDQLESEIESFGDCTFDIVPVLQRATLGFIYRYLTDDQDGWRKLLIDGGDNHDERRRSFSSCSTSLSSNVACSDEDEDDHDHDPCGQSVPSLLQRYLVGITNIRMIILAQARSIWFLFPKWMYQSFSNLFREEEAAMGPIRDFARQAIESAKPGSPLHQLSCRSSHSSTKAMLDETITLLFAGQDTSAATLSWTIHLLSLYPDVQAKLAEEIEYIMGEDKGYITRAHVSKATYLDAVIRESTRLYPVAPFVVRRLPHDVRVDSEGGKGDDCVMLQEDVLVCIWIYGLHRNPTLWEDPDRFWPERWLQTNEETGESSIPSGSFMPFCVGPRNCVGQPLAHWILRLTLGELIRGFQVIDSRLHQAGKTNYPEVEESELLGLRKKMQAGFTVLPLGGVRVKAEKRVA